MPKKRRNAHAAATGRGEAGTAVGCGHDFKGID